MRSSGRSRLSILAVLAGACASLLACSGKTVALPTCDGGDCASSDGGADGSAGAFPFSGPSCSGPAYNLSCWQCVHASCPATESCLTSECSGFFDCYCACPQGGTSCQQSCEGALSTACQSCAVSVTDCQKQSCPAQCTADGG
jgi:hypothetical protein